MKSTSQLSSIHMQDCNEERKVKGADEIATKLEAMHQLVVKIYGEESVRSMGEEEDIQDHQRIENLYRVIFGKELQDNNYHNAMLEMENKIAEAVAKKSLEDKITSKVVDLMEKKQIQYMNEMKLQIIKQQTGGVDNANTLKKYAQIEILETKALPKPLMEFLRPGNMEDIVGQREAISALISKIASPYPQHVIIYGPPGVGKTTAARLALQHAIEMDYTPFSKDAKFVEVDGTTLRWDPREITNPLLGSVHDPIYQGSKKDLAETGIPEPKLGLVTEAHGGVLFIDEIGELDVLLQNKLLKVLENKRVQFDSAYYDPQDPNVPKYIKKLFEDGAPADFILIGATTRQPNEINEALRSRCAEVFFQPLRDKDIVDIVEDAAKRIKAEIEDGVAQLISQYTVQGRKAIGILADAYTTALYNKKDVDSVKISCDEVNRVIRHGRFSPCITIKASDKPEVGKIMGVGVYGYTGSIIELECVAFEKKAGRGNIRFNDTSGSMAKDAFFNSASVIRNIEGIDISNYDIHLNWIGGGNVNGPSAGVAMATVIYSAIMGIPIRQDVAVTGEISIRGNVKAVGGITEKIYSAAQAGMKAIIIPKDNLAEVCTDISDIEVIAIENIKEALDILLT